MARQNASGSATMIAQPPTTLLDLPKELIHQIHDHVHDRNNSKSTFDIATSPREDQPGADALSRVCRSLRQVILADFLTTTFRYVSPCSGSRNGNLDGDQISDLLYWWMTVAHPFGPAKPKGRSIRKITLEMYASELLWLFAPDTASELLGMPPLRYRLGWQLVDGALKQLQLGELEVVIMDHVCPEPCRNGLMRNGLRVRPVNSDGSTPRHFSPDHRWVVKAILDSMQALAPSALSIFWLGRRLSQQELGLIAGCSWTMLDSSSCYHFCDTLSCGDMRDRYRASLTAEDIPYKTPVVYANVGRASRWFDCEYKTTPLIQGEMLRRLFCEIGSDEDNAG